MGYCSDQTHPESGLALLTTAERKTFSETFDIRSFASANESITFSRSATCSYESLSLNYGIDCLGTI